MGAANGKGGSADLPTRSTASIVPSFKLDGLSRGIEVISTKSELSWAASLKVPL